MKCLICSSNKEILNIIFQALSIDVAELKENQIKMKQKTQVKGKD